MFEVPRINANLFIGDYAQFPAGYQDWLLTPMPFKEFGQWGFRSQHPGGANFLMGDGSVRLIKDSVDLATYRAGHPQGGGGRQCRSLLMMAAEPCGSSPPCCRP